MSHRIAIIEDEAPILELYRLKLESEGFHVSTATNGIEGIELLKAHKPHLILLDIMMPEMDGVELLRHAQSNDLLPKATIILTNLAYDDARDQVSELPVDDIFVKVETTPVRIGHRIKELLA